MTPKEIYQLVIDAGSDHLGVFGGEYRGGVNLQQVPDEITPCLYFLQIGTAIKNYLEIGVASGGLTYLINEVFHPEKIVLVDNNHHTKSKWRGNILKDIDYIQIIGNSQSEKIVESIYNLDLMFDLVVIDADHFYRGVKLDIENYKQVSRDFILLHDTVACKGVKQAFEELKEDEEFKFMYEFISSSPIKCGLGLFRRRNDFE